MVCPNRLVTGCVTEQQQIHKTNSSQIITQGQSCQTQGTHTLVSVTTHCPCFIIYTPCSWSSAADLSSLVHLPLIKLWTCMDIPLILKPFGKCAFKNKQGCSESPWHADNGFTASCRSGVREQTTPSLLGAGRGGEV